MIRLLVAGLACGFVLCMISGCALSTDQRGVIEFGRMRVTTAVTALPQPAEAPNVRYPEVLLAENIEGTAELSFVVGVDGVPGSIEVQAASDPAFGAAAAEAVRALRYVPARHEGKRVPCRVEQTFFFRIR